MRDTPSNTTTARTLTVGGAAIQDTLDFTGDHDWFAVTLVAGETYTFTTASTTGINDTSTDTTLALRDPSGKLIAFNDDYDNPPGQMSKITFTATASGTYYLDVGGYNDDDTGDYSISAVIATPPALPVFDNDEIALQLTDGYWGGDQHHFDVAPGGTLDVHINTLNADGQFLARTALDLWTDVTGIVFAEVNSPANADITFTDNQSGAFTSFSFSNGITIEAAVNVSTAWVSTYGAGLNSYSLQTYVHEIGHALGLGHGGDYNGSATYPQDALYANDSWASTVMSYFDPRYDNDWFSDLGFTGQYTITPVVADIVAATNLYGERVGLTRTGDTTYGFNNDSGRDVYDPSITGGAMVAIIDDGGIDTLDYSQTGAAQQIYLEPEQFSNVVGLIGNLVIARGTVIENALGGSGSDILIGNAADNVLTGNAGNDFLYGEGGNDTLLGGEGDDEIDGGGGSDTIIASAGADLLSGGASGDTFVFGAALGVVGAVVITDFERGDVLDFTTGTGDPVQLALFIGTAAFSSTAGEYRYELSGGQTVVQYDGDGDGNSDGQVIIANGEFSLAQLTAEGIALNMLGMATNVITGTDSSDYINGTAGDDDISTLNANDFIHASPGTDTVDGGQGNDRLIFRMDDPGYFPAFSGAQTYTLTASRLSDDNGRVDTSFTSVELIEFISSSDDMVTFDASAFVPTTPEQFVFYPLTVRMEGDNSDVTGSAYNDWFTFTGVGHVVDGGAGIDLFTIAPLASAETVFITSAGGVTTATRGDGSGVADLNVEATNVELVRVEIQTDGSVSQTVDASGSALGVSFNDGNGDDTFIGSDQADNFFHSDFSAGNGTDVYWGGAGDDTYSFGQGLSQFDGTTIMDFAEGDVIDLNTNPFSVVPITTFLGTDAFTGTAGEYRYYHSGGQTFVEYDGDGDGSADGTLTIANGELTLEQFTTFAGDNNLRIGAAPPNVITGTPQRDTLTGTEGVDEIFGLGENDELQGLGGDDLLDGGDGRDRLDGGEGNDTMRGGDGSDFYRVDSTLDVIVELENEGYDTVRTSVDYTLSDHVEVLVMTGSATYGGGSDQANTIDAGAISGSVTIDGGGGNDSIRGSLFDDIINGDDGDDYIFGDKGNDTINGGAGRDTIVAGLGDDTVYGGDDNDILIGAGGNDTMYGGLGVDVLAGKEGNDTLRGEEGNDRLYGEDGDDYIYGGDGFDNVEGGAGVDHIHGGAGQDYFHGGTEGDFFIFDEPDMAGLTSGSADRILDFSHAQGDQIDVSAIDAIAGGTDDPFTFIGEDAFSGTAGEMRYLQINQFTLIQMDTDGDGRADYAIRLEGQVDLLADDFIL